MSDESEHLIEQAEMLLTDTVCQRCGGTGKRWIWRSEVDPRFVGWCEPCVGTGRMDQSNAPVSQAGSRLRSRLKP